MRSDLKILAVLLILVFGMNLAGEIQEGHCGESCSETRVDTAMKTGLPDATTLGAPQANDTDDRRHDSRSCHFGHCAHIALMQPPPSQFAIPAEENWRLVSESASSRDTTLLLRPPIS